MAKSDALGERETQDLAVALGNTEVITECWEQDGQGVQPDGVMGGDGAGESVSVRYLNRHLPSAQITAYFYVVDMRDRDATDAPEPGPFTVEDMTEYFLAAGPISDLDAPEAWSDYEYHDSGRSYATEEAALAARDSLAARDTAAAYTWDGKQR